MAAKLTVVPDGQDTRPTARELYEHAVRANMALIASLPDDDLIGLSARALTGAYERRIAKLGRA